MRQTKILNFTFVVNFRGGTYCTQVKAQNVNRSIQEWIRHIRNEKDQIQYLGKKTIEELEKEAKDDLSKATPLNGLNNIWFKMFLTKTGSFEIYIIKTDT